MDDKSSDELLARQAKEGDTAAFEELFNRYKKPLLNFIYRFIGNRQTAEEVTIEVFMKAYSNLDIYDPNKKFATWIYTIARNLSKNSLRDRKYFRDASLDESVFDKDESITLKDVIADTSASPDVIAQDEELSEIAQKILDSLPDKYKEVITLCSVQELSYQEAAAILGISVAGVSIRLNEAKKLFMKKLGEIT
ncbi:MAG: sigma-70 family RNA polymerase sigma factor [Candidatus Omnitrophica bacterium]|nr:sigma-70 family RNA polymerase sigma factor [Candidatus Omnitrophota bacterium]MDD5436324.1 sigma-70 family RNA polymerase sigma factor [Candidatus Omnitrophota bacterium]